jgi:hypothetical protein
VLFHMDTTRTPCFPSFRRLMLLLQLYVVVMPSRNVSCIYSLSFSIKHNWPFIYVNESDDQ